MSPMTEGQSNLTHRTLSSLGVDPAASEKVRDAGSDHATSANYDPHDVSTDIYRSAAPAQARFIGYPLARPLG